MEELAPSPPFADCSLWQAQHWHQCDNGDITDRRPEVAKGVSFKVCLCVVWHLHPFLLCVRRGCGGGRGVSVVMDRDGAASGMDPTRGVEMLMAGWEPERAQELWGAPHVQQLYERPATIAHGDAAGVMEAHSSCFLTCPGTYSNRFGGE